MNAPEIVDPSGETVIVITSTILPASFQVVRVVCAPTIVTATI
jgi:hypothetical protein